MFSWVADDTPSITLSHLYSGIPTAYVGCLHQLSQFFPSFEAFLSYLWNVRAFAEYFTV